MAKRTSGEGKNGEQGRRASSHGEKDVKPLKKGRLAMGKRTSSHGKKDV